MGLKFSYVEDKSTSMCDSLLVMDRAGKTTGDCYGLLLDVSGTLKGGSATVEARSWGVGILGDKDGLAATYGDCALLRISGNNYDANAETFNVRGLNCSIANRSGGIVGELSNTISTSLKSGSVTSKSIALMVDSQHQAGADNPDELGGIDVALNYEGGEATIEYGIKVRTRGSVNVPVDYALYFAKGTDYGFTNLLGVDAAATLGIVAKTSHTVSHVIPIAIAGVTYYIPIGTVVS